MTCRYILSTGCLEKLALQYNYFFVFDEKRFFRVIIIELLQG